MQMHIYIYMQKQEKRGEADIATIIHGNNDNHVVLRTVSKTYLLKFQQGMTRLMWLRYILSIPRAGIPSNACAIFQIHPIHRT